MSKPMCCHGGEESPFKFKKLFPELKKCKTTDSQNHKLGEYMTKLTTNKDLNIDVPAMYTFIGQFVDHDITFNETEDFNQVGGNINSRIPYLELDTVYGNGPSKSPQLYNKEGTHLLWDKKHNDLQRNSKGVAIIGDPRNDENLIIAKIQLLFIKFHNKVVDYYLNKYDARNAFKKSRHAVIQYYQSLVINDFLRKIIHSCIIKDIIKRGNKYYKPGKKLWFPHEFSVCAFRYGHATILGEYQINSKQTLSLDELFELRKNKHVDWRYFLNIDKTVAPQSTKKIAPFLVPALTNIPGKPPAPLKKNSLAIRNLHRSEQYGITSGQECAKKMNHKEVCLDKYKGLAKVGLDKDTPLWYYILAEADVKENGKRLGVVGGRIVAEVIIETARRSPYSIFGKKKTHIKNLGCRKKITFKKLIKFVEDY